MKKKFKYIYGPVSSWRLGRSLGIDPISQKDKICSFDCVYCQVGRMKPKVINRKVYIPTKKIIKELQRLPKVKVDYITLSARGEPTLAKNLGDLIRKIKQVRKEPVVVLTNASLINKEEVRKALAFSDYVFAKLDAGSASLFRKINKPCKTVKFNNVINGLKKFKHEYKGFFALQIMFLDENKKYAHALYKIAKKIRPDQIQINTPLRPCKCKPLSKSAIAKISRKFSDFNTVSVYDSKRKKVKPLNKAETLKRRAS